MKAATKGTTTCLLSMLGHCFHKLAELDDTNGMPQSAHKSRYSLYWCRISRLASFEGVICLAAWDSICEQL